MLSNKSLVATCAVAFCCNVALLVLFVKYNSGEKCFITINEHQKSSNIMPDNFLSVGIDTSEIVDFRQSAFTKPRLQQLASALAPGRLRLGGTMSEGLIFSDDNLSTASCDHCTRYPQSKSVCPAIKTLCKHKILPFFIMTSKEWTAINEFSRAINLRLLFTLNVLLRDEHGKWNDQNARDIIQYSKIKQFDLDWQLGNEPNSFQHVFNVSLTPHALAQDFQRLRKIITEFGNKHSLLVGPDTTRPQREHPYCLEFMREFLGNGSKYINVVSWHQYYLNSRTAALDDFWNPDTFDLLRIQIETMRNHTKKYRHIPMWLTETSSSYGGGAPELSNTYAGSPLWLDKLGLAAKYNITTVVRQSLIGGNYSMIDKNLEPLPDWWISILYKKLVGNKVLHIDCKCSKYQRLYAHCANKKYTNDTSAVTLFGINLEMAKAKFLLNGTALHGDNLLIDEYVISAPSNNRKTKTVLLNGWALSYEGTLPNLLPVKLRYGKHIAMPPYSLAFWVIKNTSIKVCK